MNLHGSLVVLQFLMCFRFHSDHWFAGIFLMKSFACFSIRQLMFYGELWIRFHFPNVSDVLYSSYEPHIIILWAVNLVVDESLLLFTVSNRVILDKCPVTQSTLSFSAGQHSFVKYYFIIQTYMRKYSWHCHSWQSNFRIRMWTM